MKRNWLIPILALATAACGKNFETADLSSEQADIQSLGQRITSTGSRLNIISSAQNLNQNTCSTEVTVQLQYPTGKPYTFSGIVGVNITSQSGNLGFYTDPSCTISTGSFMMKGTTATGIVYFKGSQPGSESITANLLS